MKTLSCNSYRPSHHFWLWLICGFGFTPLSQILHLLLFQSDSFITPSMCFSGLVVAMTAQGQPEKCYPFRCLRGFWEQTVGELLKRLAPCHDMSHLGSDSTLADFLSYADVLESVCQNHSVSNLGITSKLFRTWR